MLEFTFAVVLGCVAGAINGIAGGATLITFPALIWLGLDPKTSNATNTIGLWPGSLGGAVGFRKDLKRKRGGVVSFLVVSLLGGAVGAWLMLTTNSATFKALVPWLILVATGLFAGQKTISAWLPQLAKGETNQRSSDIGIMLFQFAVAVYGGYFGAGIGVLMLAGLGFLGVEDLHERNGIKNLAATCINGVAALLFCFGGALGFSANGALVHWPMAAAMAAGSIVGGYWSAGLAKRVGPKAVRAVVIVIGLISSLWALLGSP